MKRDSVKKNYLYNISYQVFMAIVPLITTPYISRILSVDGIGIYSYSYSMVRYFWLLSILGTATYGLRIIGISQENLQERSYKFWNLFILKTILSIFCIFAYYSYIFMIPNNKTIGAIQGIYLLAAMFDISWFYQGMENFKKISIKNFVVKIMNVVFIFVFIKNQSDLLLYTFGLAFFQFAGNISMWFSLKKYITRIEIKKLKPLEYLKPSAELFIPSVSAQIFSVIDKSMIGWITKNSAENGYYEQAMKIIDVSLVFITTIGTIMVPSISRAYKNGDKKSVIQSLNKSLNFIYFLGIPMMIGIISISDKFVPLFFGNGYEKSIYILDILSLLYMFMGINTVVGTQYMISTGQQRKHTCFLLISGTVNVILNYLLINKILSIGAAIASVIGEITLTILENIFLIKTKQYDFRKTAKKSIHYIISSTIMAIFIRLFINRVHNLISLIILIAGAGVIYISTLVLLKDQFLLEQLNNIKKKITEKKK